MQASVSGRGRSVIIPEVIQTSEMDCGPATLSALLGGFRVDVSYGRLREACQTDLDGTSIDRLEEIARQLGLDAEQVIIPREHIFLDFAESLPAIVVVRRPSGTPHFVVCWRRHGDLVQIMDPARGRSFQRTSRFTEDLFIHSQKVSAESVVEWLGQKGFQLPLFLRLRRLGFSHGGAERIMAKARAQSGWRHWARLDAAVRMVASLLASGAIGRGGESRRLLETVVDKPDGDDDIAQGHWSMTAAHAGKERDASDDEPEEVILRGAVLIMVHGRIAESRDQAAARINALPSDLRAALVEPPVRPLSTLLGLLPRREHAVLGLAALAALVGAGLQLGLDALFRGTLHLSWYTRNPLHRLSAFAVGVIFVLALGALALLIGLNAIRLGRYIEVRLRATLLDKLPHLNERYFHSRPVSDMAERAHSLWRVRQFTSLFLDGVRTIGGALLISLSLIFFLPQQRPIVLALLAMALGVPLLVQPLLVGLDLRVRTYNSSLTKAFLDSLIGMSPLRTHGGERPLSRQFEELLSNWARTRLLALRVQVGMQGFKLLLCYGLIGWLVARYIGDGGSAAGLLLLYYWAIGLPTAGSELTQTLLVYPDIRNVTARLIEPLGAPTEKPIAQEAPPPAAPADLILLGVSVVVAGQTILRDVTLDIPAGAHIAVVGASGAGKSTLIGLLLGFHRVAEGQVILDGTAAQPADFLRLRNQVAWVDPDIRVWNRSLFDNLQNGQPEGRPDALSSALATADLLRVMGRLPAGLATPLGEGGRLLSGGEGQRVRLGRALLQAAPRLVLLDEPFRGLDRQQRQQLLDRVLAAFAGTTLIYISHDIGSTLPFAKVVVIEDGHIVEAGSPEKLRADSGSRYSAMLSAEDEVRRELWAEGPWQRLRMENGQLRNEVISVEDSSVRGSDGGGDDGEPGPAARRAN